jgi:putative peptidoglycan lipid II flippase
LITCLAYNLPVEVLCYILLMGGLITFLLHLAVYLKLNFRFLSIDAQAWNNFKHVFSKFIPCMLGMSVMEINLFVDTSLASYLHTGSIALVYYANRFMGIPLGVFATALATVLLPHFTRIGMEDKNRLSFYLLESSKLIFWIMIPVTLIMTFLSRNIFLTLFLSKKFTLPQVIEASHILNAFLIGLFFFALNKILLSIYYALHETRIPAWISIISASINMFADIVLIYRFGAVGLALATTIAGIAGTALSLYYLNKNFNISIDWSLFIRFMGHCFAQLLIMVPIFYLLYQILFMAMSQYFSPWFIQGIGFWFWASPLGLLFFLVHLMTRRWFGLELYFLD